LESAFATGMHGKDWGVPRAPASLVHVLIATRES